MQHYGIGQKEPTSVSVVPAQIHIETVPDLLRKKSLTPMAMAEKDFGNDEPDRDSMNNLEKFYSSVKSRLLVAEVITRIESGAKFTFDYLLLLVLAAMIAFFGLTENSPVVLVASMLVSPMMGPILAGKIRN